MPLVTDKELLAEMLQHGPSYDPRIVERIQHDMGYSAYMMAVVWPEIEPDVDALMSREPREASPA